MTAGAAPGAQARVVANEDPLLLVTGGPGTGKTRTALLLAGRVLDEPPARDGRRALFLTFSRAAVSEIVHRAPELTPQRIEQIDVSTFHSFARTIIDSFGRYAGRGVEPLAIASEAEVKLGVAPPGALRYDQLVPAAIDVLTRAPQARELLSARYRIVICDEFQDTGDDQWRLLRLVAEGTRLVALADPEQLIHDFRDGVGPHRLDELRALGPTEICLEARSYRDPSGTMPALAAALRDRGLTRPVVVKSIADERLRVIRADDTPWTATIAEVIARRRAGAASVGIFVSQRRFVAELARELVSAGIEHEIAGLDDAAGEAELAIATMAGFAVRTISDEELRTRIAVFLVAATERRDSVPIAELLLRQPDQLPARARRWLDELRAALPDQAGEPIGALFDLADQAIDLVWGVRLWRMGAQDLRGQSVDLLAGPLKPDTAGALARVATMRRAEGGLMDLGLPHLPVRLMTRHQAKGREMDAIVLVAHPEDYLPDRDPFDRVTFVAASRAKGSLSIILPTEPHVFYRPLLILISGTG